MRWEQRIATGGGSQPCTQGESSKEWITPLLNSTVASLTVWVNDPWTENSPTNL